MNPKPGLSGETGLPVASPALCPNSVPLCPHTRGECLHHQALQPALPAQVKQWQELQVPRGGVQHHAAHRGGQVRLSSWLHHEEQHLHKGR